MGNYAKFTLQGSYSRRGKVGHLVKSRAKENYILYNRITDEAGGTASYEIDLPNGGLSVVLGNLIEQASTTQNPAMLSYAAEGLTAGYDARLFVVNNTFLNNRMSGTFVANATTTPGVLRNNIFWNGGTVSSQAAAQQSSNFVGPAMGDPLFTDVAKYDVRLKTGSPCIDTGTDAGSVGSQSLLASQHYVHPLSQQARQTVGGTIDIGAYEFGVAITSPDAGSSGGEDGGTGGGGGGGGGGGTAPAGCSCSLGATAGSSPGGGALSLASLLSLLALVRRRQRREAAR
jgi:MYXO-CTERM domain-containing protein